MSSEFVRNECPPTCPMVKKYIRAQIEKEPWLLEIFPQRNDVCPQLLPDINQEKFKEIQQDEMIDVVHKKSIDYSEKIKKIPSKVVEDVVKIKPIQEETVIQKLPIIQEQAVISVKRITDRDEKIDLVKEEEFPIIQEQAVIQDGMIDIVHKRSIDYEKIEEIPSKVIEDIVEVKSIQEETTVQERAVISTKRITDLDDEKIDLVEEEKFDQEIAIIQKQAVISIEKIADYNERKIDLIKEKELMTKTTVAKIKKISKKSEIIEDKIEQAAIAKTELELPQELEYSEPEKDIEYDEDEEGLTDYEKFIDEELQEFLPAVIAKKIPEEPRAMRQGISRNAVHEKIDRDKPSREFKERRAEEGVSAKVKQIVSHKPVTADVCDETCPLIKEQKERFICELKKRQRIVDHYYLTKGFNYFEDVCTCSLACMVYTMSRDPFVRSVFASLTLFAVGLKLCSELDAWEMPKRIS